MTDRELDVAVAEKVFGLPRTGTDDAAGEPLFGREGKPWATERARCYSSSGDGMLDVLNEMCAKGWVPDLDRCGHGKLGMEEAPLVERKWKCMFYVEDWNDPRAEKFGDGRWPNGRDVSAPRAVCLAALAALA